MHKSGENRIAPYRLHLLMCYTSILMVYAGDDIYVQVEIENYDLFYEICIL